MRAVSTGAGITALLSLALIIIMGVSVGGTTTTTTTSTTSTTEKPEPTTTIAPNDESLAKFLEKTIPAKHINKKIIHILKKIPLNSESKSKVKDLLLKMGKQLPRGSKRGLILDVVVPVGRHFETCFNSFIGLFRSRKKPTTTTTTTTTKTPTTTTTITTTTTTTTTAKPTRNPGEMLCQPCCDAEMKAVCFAPKCPEVPSNKSECAFMPLCYPPCQLQARQNLNSTTVKPKSCKDTGYDDYDGDIELDFGLEGIRFFNKVMRESKNETLSEMILDLVDSMYERVDDELYQDVIEVFQYFRDDNIVNVRPDSGHIVRGLFGHIFDFAIRKEPPPQANSRSGSITSLRSSSKLPKIKKYNQWEQGRKFCPPCDGSCETDPSACNKICPNNPDCPIGQCVCNTD